MSKRRFHQFVSHSKINFNNYHENSIIFILQNISLSPIFATAHVVLHVIYVSALAHHLNLALFN